MKLLSDNIAILVENAAPQKTGGLYIPKAASEELIKTGKVSFVGPGRIFENGGRALVSVVVGDTVAYRAHYSDSTLEYQNNKYVIISEQSIVAII